MATRFSFAGKRVFLTGGSSGIGEAMARQLVDEGAHLAIAARGAEGLERTLAELRRRSSDDGQILSSVSVDIGDREAVAEAAKEVLDRLGGIDVVVNNAGITHPANFLDTPDETFEAMMRINFFGSVNVTRAFVPTLIEGGGGRIAFVSSLAGVLGIYGYSAYASTKFALRGFADCLRQDLLQHGVGVTVILPPDTDTPQLAKENLIKPPETQAIAGTVKPLSAEFVARAGLDGIRKGRWQVAPGLGTKFVVFMVDHFPRLTRWVIDGDLRRFQRKQLREGEGPPGGRG